MSAGEENITISQKINIRQKVVTCERCKQEAEGKNYPFYFVATISGSMTVSSRSDGYAGTQHSWKERKLLADEWSIPLCNRCIKRQGKRGRFLHLVIACLLFSVGTGSCIYSLQTNNVRNEFFFWVGLVALVLSVIYVWVSLPFSKKDPTDLAISIVEWKKYDEIRERKKQLKESLKATVPQDHIVRIEFLKDAI